MNTTRKNVLILILLLVSTVRSYGEEPTGTEGSLFLSYRKPEMVFNKDKGIREIEFNIDFSKTNGPEYTSKGYIGEVEYYDDNKRFSQSLKISFSSGQGPRIICREFGRHGWETNYYYDVESVIIHFPTRRLQISA